MCIRDSALTAHGTIPGMRYGAGTLNSPLGMTSSNVATSSGFISGVKPGDVIDVYKRQGEPLVSGINCQPQSVYDDFLNTKLLYHKDGGVMFYHMVQSFPKGAAVDPRQAHEAARRLAEYFDGCEVLVCTHVDREHIHSHCVINSVNFDTGKKLHMAKEQIQELMRRNDMICQEMGLPVFESTAQQARGMSGAEYHTALKGQSWKLRLMNTIDECKMCIRDSSGSKCHKSKLSSSIISRSQPSL